MAAGTKLQLQFETMSGTKTWTFSNAKSNATTANVRTLAQTMITNGTLFQYQPIRVSSAKIVTTTENVLDVS